MYTPINKNPSIIKKQYPTIKEARFNISRKNDADKVPIKSNKPIMKRK